MTPSLHTIVLASFLSACAAGTARDPREGSVNARDFFFYSCVREYLQANSIRNFDGSLAYAVEYSSMPADELDRIYAAAATFAKTLSAPNYSDPEHGLPPVLVSCEKEAKRFE